MIPPLPARTTVALIRVPGGPFELTDVEIPVLADGEILVHMRGTGICHTDLVAQAGGIPLEPPFVVGHEGAGIVAAAAPNVTELAVGDAVVLSFDHCTECAQCFAGHPAYCELSGAMNYFGARVDGTVTMSRNGEDIHGSWFGQSSFATYAVATVRNAVKVADDLPLDILGPLGCGLQTGAGTIFNVLKPEADQSIAIFGAGTVGLAAVMAAKVAGCDPLIVLDVDSRRLELAREFGATHAINTGDKWNDVRWAIAEITSLGVDFAVETVGSDAVVRLAAESLRTPGVCATLGLKGIKQEITIDQGHLLMGRSLVGVIGGDSDPHRIIPHLIDLWRDGKFPFDRLVERFAFDRIDHAVAAFRSGKVVKPVLVFDSAVGEQQWPDRTSSCTSTANGPTATSTNTPGRGSSRLRLP